MNFQRTDTHPPPPSVHARWQSECQQGPTTRNYQYMYSGTVKFMHIIKSFTSIRIGSRGSENLHARCMRALLAGWDACVRARWLENAWRQPDNRDSSIQEIPHTLHPGSTPCTRTMRPRAHTHHPGCARILSLGVTRGKK